MRWGRIFAKRIAKVLNGAVVLDDNRAALMPCKRGWVGMQVSPNQSFAVIADDDADVREMLSMAVGRIGLVSIPVEDGRQAIEMLADLSPSVVLLDVQMPGLSGIEVCWWIRRQRHLADVPVILVSALTSQFEIDAGLLAGANQYVTKPFTSAHVTAVVAHHLVGRPFLPPPSRVIITDPTD